MANYNHPALNHGYISTRPSALLNSLFMTTVNSAAKTLVAVASRAKAEHVDQKWRPVDHIRFMLMLMTWLTVWILRVLMDHLPFSGVLSSASSSSSAAAESVDYPYQLLDPGMSTVRSFDFLASSPSPALSGALSAFSSSSTFLDSSLDLVVSEGSEAASVKALGRALTNIFALMNEIPASSRKYQFAVAMAEKIVDENARGGHVELLLINRTALASAFVRTSGLLYSSLQAANQLTEESGSCITRVVGALPLGSYLSYFMKGLGTVFPALGGDTCRFNKKKQLALGGEERSNDLAAEKHAQELLWITNKMRACGAVDEALVQWSLASGLASIALVANRRVQGFIVKISAILFKELKQADLELPRQVKFRLLALWLPLFCYSDNGLSYPVMTGYEEAEMERTMNELISSLPAIDQEVILTNWLQDFTNCSSDWPNLQVSYDKWCHSTRNLIL